MMGRRNASATCTVFEQLEISRLKECQSLEECEKSLHAIHMVPCLHKEDQKFSPRVRTNDEFEKLPVISLVDTTSDCQHGIHKAQREAI